MAQEPNPEQQPKRRIAAVLSRGVFAHVMMTNLVVCTSVGAGLIYLPAGFITFGLASGMYGYLLGAD